MTPGAAARRRFARPPRHSRFLILMTSHNYQTLCIPPHDPKIYSHPHIPLYHGIAPIRSDVQNLSFARFLEGVMKPTLSSVPPSGENFLHVLIPIIALA